MGTLEVKAIFKQIDDIVAAQPASPAMDKLTKAVEELENQVIPDTKVYNAIVKFLGVAVLLAVVGIGILAGFGKTTPEALTALASVGVGALAGALNLK